MTVSTTLNKITYTGDGATPTFAFSFPVISASNLQVFFTDLNGVITQQFTGFTVSLNPATGQNPTQAGGSVTFSSPPTFGFKVTLFRSLPLTQATSLANQGTLYQPVEEAALDYGVMVSQQVLEVQSRALQVSVSDSTPGLLPPATQRAGLGLGFDSQGNPIAISLAPAGTISSAMAPVVASASLAAGRTAFGLGTAAIEGIGGGLQDDGAGNLRTFFNVVSDSTPQTVTSSFHSNIRAATGALTYTFPRANTLFNGFGFWVYALTGALTFAINAADAFSGAASGASLVIPAGARVFICTDAAASGIWYVRDWMFQGRSSPLNCTLSASVAASALTIALKDANGNDPSAASPVFFTVQNGSGGLIQRAVVTPLSITVPLNATLGTANGQTNRIWVHLFDNAGTPVLGVYNSLNSTTLSILPWNETIAQTTTNISAGSTLPQTHYTNGGLNSKFFVPLGFVESTQATAGTWVTGPSNVGLFGPGVKKPGDTVGEIAALLGAGSTASTTLVVLASSTYSMVSAANVVRVDCFGWAANSADAASNITQLSRGNTNNSSLLSAQSKCTVGGSTGFCPFSLFAYDIPNVAGNQIYSLQGAVVGAATLTLSANNSQISFRELQI